MDQLIHVLTGEAITTKYTPKELVQLHKNWVYAANNKIASTMSTIPIKLYYKGKPTKTPHKELSTKRLSSIQKAIKKEVKIVEITEHPILDLFKNINDNMNYTDMVMQVTQYLGILGTAFVRIERKDNQIIALHPLLSEYVTPLATNSKDGKITAYEYNIDDKSKVTYSAEDIIQFTNFIPGNNIIGTGELELCLQAALRYNYYDAYEMYLAKNNSRPDNLIFNFKKNLQQKEREELVKQLKKQYNGVRQVGKPLIAEGELDIKNLGLAPKDLEYQVGRKWSREEICAVYGVPLALVTTESINRANAFAAMDFFQKYTIYPKMSRFCEKMNEQLVSEYDPNAFIWFEERSVLDPSEQANITITAYEKGIIDKNEARSILGFEMVDESKGDTNEG